MIKRIILIIVILLLLTSTASAKVFLVLATSTSTGNSVFNFEYHEVEDMETCFAIVDNAKIALPHGGDAETTAIMYCAPTEAKIWDYKERDRD